MGKHVNSWATGEFYYLTSQSLILFMALSMQDASNDGLFAVLVDEPKLADPEMVTKILTYIYSERRE